MTDLPGILGEIAEIAGEGAALQVAAAKGGLEKVHIPYAANLYPDHWLVKAVGAEKAAKIAEALGGDAKVDIPLGPLGGSRHRAKHALKKALGSGSSTASAARLAGVHQRTARRAKMAAQAEPEETAQILLPLRGGSGV